MKLIFAQDTSTMLDNSNAHSLMETPCLTIIASNVFGSNGETLFLFGLWIFNSSRLVIEMDEMKNSLELVVECWTDNIEITRQNPTADCWKFFEIPPCQCGKFRSIPEKFHFSTRSYEYSQCSMFDVVN